MELKRHYIVDEQNQKIAVQLDIKTFEKIEEILENHALYQLMHLDEDDDGELDGDEAKAYYNGLGHTP